MADKSHLRVDKKKATPTPPDHAGHAKVVPDLGSSFIDPTALISGRVELGEKDYIGPFVRLEARRAFSVKLSDEDNLQDNVSVSATNRNMLVGERTTIAHGARVINSTLGNFVFIGFNAWIENAVVEDGAMVLHGAKVRGVTIPKDRVVPPGAVITSQAQAQSLLAVEEENNEFKEEVISVNIELAKGYAQMGGDSTDTQGSGPNPITSWNTGSQYPSLGDQVDLSKGARIIGPVQLGLACSVGSQTSIRADEGVPITIGDGARIGNRVTFHALKGQSIAIGDELTTGDGVVFHGALSLGYKVSVGNNTVLFKSSVGSYTSIGENAVVVGVILAEHSRVPDRALVLDQQEADKYAPGK